MTRRRLALPAVLACLALSAPALAQPEDWLRPSPISPGTSSRSSSRSSAISPVSTSSRNRPAIPGPIPRSSRTRSVRTSAVTGAGLERIVSAARRYARTVYGLASASSSRAANASNRSAMAGFST